MSRGVCVIAVCSALFAAQAFAGDVTIISTMTSGKKTVTERLVVTDGRILLAQGDAGCIVDGASGRMTMFDTSTGKYFETSIEELAAYSERIIPKNKFVRKIMRKNLGDLKVTKTTVTRTVAGYECDVYEEVSGFGTFHVCATTKITPPPSFYDTMEKMYAAAMPFGDPISPLYAAMRKAGAMPLSTNLTAMKVSLVDTLTAAMNTIESGMGVPAPPPDLPAQEASLMSSEVSEVSLEPIPPARFELPAGLTKVDSPYAVKAKK